MFFKVICQRSRSQGSKNVNFAKIVPMTMKFYTELKCIWERLHIDFQGHMSIFKVTAIINRANLRRGLCSVSVNLQGVAIAGGRIVPGQVGLSNAVF